MRMSALVPNLLLFSLLCSPLLALESDRYTINPPPVPMEALVSFSIGYPKGWKVSQDDRLQRQPVYNDLIVPVDNWVCSFSDTNTFRLMPTNFNTNSKIVLTNFTDFTIWRSGGTIAKEEAEKLSAFMQKSGLYQKMDLRQVKTAGGETGWLLESRSINGHSWIAHDFFFHAGPRGCIRIMIVTSENESAWRSDLDRLILETLRFSEDKP
jgi:hypothetical protein